MQKLGQHLSLPLYLSFSLSIIDDFPIRSFYNLFIFPFLCMYVCDTFSVSTMIPTPHHTTPHRALTVDSMKKRTEVSMHIIHLLVVHIFTLF